MKRRINRGEKGLKSKRNQLKRKYFEMYSWVVTWYLIWSLTFVGTNNVWLTCC
jgi:hypothetical protein